MNAILSLRHAGVDPTQGLDQMIQQRKQLQNDLEQVGKDLQGGNLSAAQADFATVQQDAAYSSAISHTNFAQAINQLSSDLQAGNLSGAQGDFSTMTQSFPSIMAPHSSHSAAPASGATASDSASDLWSELGQAIQSGSLSTAYQAYTKLGQELQQFGTGSASNSARGILGQLVSTGLSLMA